MDSASGKYYLPLTIDGFDVNFQGFHHIEVQYKASSEADTRWTNICSFFTDTTYYEEASGTKEFITGRPSPPASSEPRTKTTTFVP